MLSGILLLLEWVAVFSCFFPHIIPENTVREVMTTVRNTAAEVSTDHACRSAIWANKSLPFHFFPPLLSEG